VKDLKAQGEMSSELVGHLEDLALAYAWCGAWGQEVELMCC
jgi:hypothetical protein